MRSVVVFGGTGSIGGVIVKNLISQGFKVKILTRNKPKNGTYGKEEYFIGNVLEYSSVEKCISEKDVVVISLGFNNSSYDTMSKGTENILKVMKAKNSSRVICLSAQGAGDSWEQMPDSFKEMVENDEILSASFKDHGIQENLIKKVI